VYRVIDDDQVHEQVAALPAEALSAYAEARTLLQVAPWAGSPYHKKKPDGPMRTLAFGVVGSTPTNRASDSCEWPTISLRSASARHLLVTSVYPLVCKLLRRVIGTPSQRNRHNAPFRTEMTSRCGGSAVSLPGYSLGEVQIAGCDGVAGLPSK
jgi:hypothetical protein